MNCLSKTDLRSDRSSPHTFKPRLMLDVELTQPLPNLRAERSTCWILVRFCTEPIGVLEVSVTETGLPAERLADCIWSLLHRAIAVRLEDSGIAPSPLGAQGFPAALSGSPYLRHRDRLLHGAPPISVVVCTRDRASRLEACLDRLTSQRFPSYEIVVVDNAPTTDAARRLVEDRYSSRDIRYVVEPVPGLSRARNTGVSAAHYDLVAFVDDDEAADEHWLAEIARGFASGPDVGCVTGLILPARLDTQAQDWFEQFGGHSKGRGFSPKLFTSHGEQSPLYPLPPFGAGGNMAFRRSVLELVNGFDVALGAGTLAKGGEDTLAFTLVLLAGYQIAYQPSALVRHDHYAELAGLAAQLRGYGTGLTAYYSALLHYRPSLVLPLLQLFPAAFADMRGKTGIRTELMTDFPSSLIRAQRRGMLAGVFAYRKEARSTSPRVTTAR